MSHPASLNLAAAALVAGLALAAAGPALGAGNAAAGARAWTEEHQAAEAPSPRSCSTCHTKDITKPGKHATTSKVIEPMAVSVNPKRLSDPAKVEKWFKRNCGWTLGRECTPQEKADFTAYLQSR
jgi:Domain of unknown function (DUF1924)